MHGRELWFLFQFPKITTFIKVAGYSYFARNFRNVDNSKISDFIKYIFEVQIRVHLVFTASVSSAGSFVVMINCISNKQLLVTKNLPYNCNRTFISFFTIIFKTSSVNYYDLEHTITTVIEDVNTNVHTFIYMHTHTPSAILITFKFTTCSSSFVIAEVYFERRQSQLVIKYL